MAHELYTRTNQKIFLPACAGSYGRAKGSRR